MSRHKKILAKITKNPRACDVTARELRGLLLDNGYEVKKKTKGSHTVYVCKADKFKRIIDSSHNDSVPVKPYVIEEVINQFKELGLIEK